MFSIIKHHLYLLQLENYNLRRFLAIVFKRPFPTDAARQKLVWTPKLILIFSLALAIYLLAAFGNILIYGWNTKGIGFALGYALIFLNSFALLLAIVTAVLKPFDFIAKSIIVARAKSKMRKFQNLKIIGITGSFGKTTMKEVLAAVLSEKFKVLKTPENINTPVGIGRLILKELSSDTEIFIVEMGAYQRGDIRALCRIAQPQIAILTGINEAHLERFGSMENTIKAKFEIVQHAKPDALIVLNEENKLVKDNYQKFVGARRVEFYSQTKSPPSVCFHHVCFSPRLPCGLPRRPMEGVGHVRG